MNVRSPVARTADAPTPPPARRRASLAARFTRLALMAAGLALIIAGAAADGAMFLIGRRDLLREMTAQTQVIADNVSAALLFQDRQSALDTLASLKRSDVVMRATVFDARDQVFADFHRLAQAALPVSAGAAGYRFEGRRLVIVEPVRGRMGPIGLLRFEVTLDPLYERTMLFAGVTGLAGAVALLLAYLLAMGVRRAVRRMEERLDQLAYRDPITNLYNRHAANEHLQEYVLTARRLGEGFTVVTVDLDNFKHINDTLGHDVGDQVLRHVAERITARLRPGDRAYRFGGDEFVIISFGKQGFSEPRRHGLITRRLLSDDVRVNDVEISLSGSVGVARFPIDGDEAEDVLRASDTAMYAAKIQGKNDVVIFDPALRAASEMRMRTERDLRRALREGELVLHYQPVVDAHTQRLVGAEALVRWLHPERGLVAPREFIEVAEQSGLVVELGGWVFTEAAAQVVRWANAGLQLSVAVNVSAQQLRGGVLVRQYRDAMAMSGCNPAWLEIELTEHTLIEDVQDNLRILTELRDLGAHIAVDDFGTGLSSLAYLKRLPIDKIKIDRSFVLDLPNDRSDSAIIAASTLVARALGLRVVAEGVETEPQRQAICRLGCDLAQGYLFSKPLDATLFAAWAQLNIQPSVAAADTAAAGPADLAGGWRVRG
jgi:diguanylate cyclase (GGDEF)-like protein